jgi:hypothetical protein
MHSLSFLLSPASSERRVIGIDQVPAPPGICSAHPNPAGLPGCLCDLYIGLALPDAMQIAFDLHDQGHGPAF